MNTTELGPSLLPTSAAALLAATLATAVAPRAQDPVPRPAAALGLAPAVPRAKPQRYAIPPGWSHEHITVKFRDGLRIRLRDGALTDFGTGALAEASAVLERLRGGSWSRTHTLSEAQLDAMRERGERNVGFALHDLNLQFRCRLPAGVDAAAIIDALNALACVELAEALPGMAPPPQQPPDLRYRQIASEPAPRGTGAGPFQGLPDNNPSYRLAATGGLARVVDIEYGFDQAHADLPPINSLTGPGFSTPAFDEHGTAVFGVLGARNDGVGTTGMAFQSQLAFARAFDPSGLYEVDASIATGAAFAGPGGIVLIEQQIGGPSWNGDPNSQFGLVPVEWHSATWQAIRNVVATGVVVVEAAGNGSQNLDDPIYGGWFSVANDSGALLVGAGAAPGVASVARARLPFSNFGETLDLQGLGEQVVTTGYGDLFNGGGPALSYTQQFGGTSSASAVVAGVAALLQSLHVERRGLFVQPAELRNALRRSSTAQAGATAASQNIGPLPDVVRAAVELRLYGGLGMALGFEEALPALGGNGLAFGAFGIDNVAALASFDDDGPGPNPTRLYVAGLFSKIGNRPCNNIACWNGVGWQELAGGLGTSGAGVQALAVHDPDGTGPGLPRLYAAGWFAGGIAAWNGTSWSSVGGGIGTGAWCLTSFDEDGPGPLPPSLIAGGDFTHAGGQPALHIARFRNGTWSQVGNGFDDRVGALTVHQGQLVAGGMFQQSGGMPMRSLATWNGVAWAELGGGTGFWGDQIHALASIPIANSNQAYLFVGGTFWQFGGVPVATHGLAVWTGGGWFMPSSPATQPFGIAAFEDGSDPLLPRQLDAYLSGPGGLYRLDLTTWVTTPLPSSGVSPGKLLAWDEDGDGVEPPSLWVTGSQFLGQVPSAGIARHFATAPVSNTGFVTILGTGCGGPYEPTIAVTGDPVLGAPFTVQFDCLPLSVPAFLAGLPQPFAIPLCGAGCAIGVDAIAIDFGAWSRTYTLPNDPQFVGATLAFQGIEFLALPHGPQCLPWFLPANLRTTATLLLTM